MKWCAHFSADFWTFTIFDCNFSKIVAPPSNGSANYLVLVKTSENTLKTASKSTHKPWQNSCSNYVPSHEERSGLGAWQTEKHSDKHNIFAPTASAHCTILTKLCMVIEHIDTIKKDVIIFQSNASFLLKGARKNSA